jgi:hypothetical protein
MLHDLLDTTVQMFDNMEASIKDDTMLWEEREIIKDLNEISLCLLFNSGKLICKMWLTIMAFPCFRGHKSTMTVGCGTYSFPFETLLMFVLSKFSRPFCLEKGMRVSFRIHCSKTVFWNQLYDSCHAFNGNAVFSQSRIFLWRLPFFID